MLQLLGNNHYKVPLIFGYELKYQSGIFKLVDERKNLLLDDINHFSLVSIEEKYYLFLGFVGIKKDTFCIYELKISNLIMIFEMNTKDNSTLENFYIGVKDKTGSYLINLDNFKITNFPQEIELSEELLKNNISYSKKYNDISLEIFLLGSYYDFYRCLDVFSQIKI